MTLRIPQTDTPPEVGHVFSMKLGGRSYDCMVLAVDVSDPLMIELRVDAPDDLRQLLN